MSLSECKPISEEDALALERLLHTITTGERGTNVIVATALLTIEGLKNAWLRDPACTETRTLFLCGQLAGAVGMLDILGYVPQNLRKHVGSLPPGLMNGEADRSPRES